VRLPGLLIECSEYALLISDYICLRRMPNCVFQMVQAFTRSGAMVEAEKGGKFRLSDGNVNGEFQELVRFQFPIGKHDNSSDKSTSTDG